MSFGVEIWNIVVDGYKPLANLPIDETSKKNH